MQHNIIFVTHEGRDKKYLYELPEGVNVEQGTLLRVRNAQDEVIAVAASNSFQADETGLEAIRGAVGARGNRDLAPVIGIYRLIDLTQSDKRESAEESDSATTYVPWDCVTCINELVRRRGGHVEPCASCPNGPGRWNGTVTLD